MTFTENCNRVFNMAINDYHVTDNIDTPIKNPFERDSIENRLYLKCWIDTVQWHFEDIIRDPHINPEEALLLKRRIDRSNQDRTDLVEQIDSYFRQLYSNSMGSRPSKHPCTEDIPHARTGRAHRCHRRAPPAMPAETRRAARTAS